MRKWRVILPGFVVAVVAGVAVMTLIRRAELLGAEETRAQMSGFAIRDADIAFFTERARRDPRGAADRAQLAGLYLQRARETGDYADFVQAEEWARQSLELRGWRNEKAYLTLASSLLGQHRFAEARAAAEALVTLDSARDSYRALLGEIQLELGDYEGARLTFNGLGTAATNLAVAPRLARWHEIEGRPERAHAILLRARREALRRPDLPREQVAWFQLRVGDLALRNGRLGEARRAFEAGLAVEPNDYRLLSAMAKLSAAQGKWRDVLSWGRRAEAVNADLATLELIGDAYATTGDSAAARRYWEAVERGHAEKPEPYARQWTAFRLDHGMRLGETREVLEREIEGRRDVLGWDLLAWSRYLTGDLALAREAMAQALRMGTRDATFFFHAGMIARTSGEREVARRYLVQALEVNPSFHHRDAAAARRALAELVGV